MDFNRNEEIVDEPIDSTDDEEEQIVVVSGLKNIYKMKKLPAGVKAYQYQCQHCSGAFHGDYEIDCHEEECHPKWMYTKKPKFFCNICTMRSDLEDNVIDHNFSRHPGNRVHYGRGFSKREFYAKYPNSCDLCSEDLGSSELLLEHKNEKHPNWKAAPGDDALEDEMYTFKCPHCPGAFVEEKDLKNHSEKDHPPYDELGNRTGEKFYCDKCPTWYYHLDWMLHHQREKHWKNLKRKVDDDKLEEEWIKKPRMTESEFLAKNPTCCKWCAKNFETVEDLEDHEYDRNAEGHPYRPERIYG